MHSLRKLVFTTSNRTRCGRRRVNFAVISNKIQNCKKKKRISIDISFLNATHGKLDVGEPKKKERKRKVEILKSCPVFTFSLTTKHPRRFCLFLCKNKNPFFSLKFFSREQNFTFNFFSYLLITSCTSGCVF